MVATADTFPTPDATSLVAYDPAIVAALLRVNAYTAPAQALAQPIMPVGAYIPRQFGVAVADLRFSGEPVVLSPPATTMPFEQAEDQGILPTAGPGDAAALVPYAGDGCAPRGLPTGGVFTQRFHMWHSGVDYGIPVGTPVTATHSGQVVFAGWSPVGYGNLVILQNGAFITYYAHLSRFNVVEGQFVGAGSTIGWSGNTGNSTGPHIHYEVRVNDVPVDPLTFDSQGYPWC
ncbi:MAG: hypothetical protein Kow0077_05940 [Anaerolineae bacterium]